MGATMGAGRVAPPGLIIDRGKGIKWQHDDENNLQDFDSWSSNDQGQEATILYNLYCSIFVSLYSVPCTLYLLLPVAHNLNL